MANQPWLDEVRERLARQALPPSYIQRFMEELSDHLEDIKELDEDWRLVAPKRGTIVQLLLFDVLPASTTNAVLGAAGHGRVWFMPRSREKSQLQLAS